MVIGLSRKQLPERERADDRVAREENEQEQQDAEVESRVGGTVTREGVFKSLVHQWLGLVGAVQDPCVEEADDDGADAEDEIENGKVPQAVGAEGERYRKGGRMDEGVVHEHHPHNEGDIDQGERILEGQHHSRPFLHLSDRQERQTTVATVREEGRRESGGGS